MADYPVSVYVPRTKENKAGIVYDASKKTVGFAEDITKLDAEVVAVETDLIAKIDQALKTTSDVIFASLTLTQAAEDIIGDVKFGGATQENGAYDLVAEDCEFMFRIWAYKTTGAKTVYSKNPLLINVYDDISENTYRWNISWAGVTGATGYKIEIYMDDYNGIGGIYGNSYHFLDAGGGAYYDNPADCIHEQPIVVTPASLIALTIEGETALANLTAGVANITTLKVTGSVYFKNTGVIHGYYTTGQLSQLLIPAWADDKTYIGPYSDKAGGLNGEIVVYRSACGNSGAGIFIVDGKLKTMRMGLTLYPDADDTYYLGEVGSPFKAYKGIILKDTADGKHYRVEVTNGSLAAVALD